MLEARMRQHLFASADHLGQVADGAARALATAAHVMVTALTAGNKVLVAGLGASAPEARTLAGGLLDGHLRTRPGLAAVLLADPAGSSGAGLRAGRTLEARLRTLAAPGDVLAVLGMELATPDDDDAAADAEAPLTRVALPALVEAAHALDLSVVALWTQLPALPPGATDPAQDAPAGGPDAARWWETDVAVPLPAGTPAQARELQLVAVHALLAGIDGQLLGELAT